MVFMMKFVYIIVCVIVCTCSCINKEKSSHIMKINGILVDTSIIKIDTTSFPILVNSGRADFVIDTTLKRLYIDEIGEQVFVPSENWKGGEVKTAKEAFEIVKPSFLEICDGNIELEKPFHINLINDELWIIYGKPHLDSIPILGGDLYVEIQKSTGAVSTIIVGE